MINGTVVGLVEDNDDPDGMHRVKVSFPASLGVSSSWCRMCTPMGGVDRGLVMLPDIGTEVLVGFTYRTMSPVVLGALYNGAEDRTEPYRNDDGNDDKRVFWSRNDHLLVFDDAPGAEAVGLGACAGSRLDVCSAPIHHVADAAGKTLTERCAGTTLYQATRKVSISCKTFSLTADRVLVRAGQTIASAASHVQIQAGATVRATAPDCQVKTGSSPPWPQAADPRSASRHPPTGTGG